MYVFSKKFGEFLKGKNYKGLWWRKREELGICINWYNNKWNNDNMWKMRYMKKINMINMLIVYDNDIWNIIHEKLYNCCEKLWIIKVTVIVCSDKNTNNDFWKAYNPSLKKRERERINKLKQGYMILNEIRTYNGAIWIIGGHICKSFVFNIYNSKAFEITRNENFRITHWLQVYHLQKCDSWMLIKSVHECTYLIHKCVRRLICQKRIATIFAHTDSTRYNPNLHI